MASTPKLMPLARLARGAFSSSVTRTHQATGTHLHRFLGYSHIDRTIATGDYIFCKPFAVGDREWLLKIYPNGVDEDHRGFVSAGITLGYGEPDATATYRVSVLDHAGDPLHSRVAGPFRFGTDRGTEIKDLVAKEELERSAPFLLGDDCVDFRCDVAMVEAKTKHRNRWFMGFGQ